MSGSLAHERADVLAQVGATRSRPGCARLSRTGSRFSSRLITCSQPSSRNGRLRRARDDADGHAAGVEDVLHGEGPESPRRAPDENLVALGDGCAVVRDQHAIRRRVAQRVDRRLLPGEVGGLGHQLVGLHDRDVREPAEVRLESPDSLIARQHRVVVAARILVVDVVAVDRDLVADLPVAHRRADPQDDPGRVRTRPRDSRGRVDVPRPTPCPSDRGSRRWAVARRCSSTQC